MKAGLAIVTVLFVVARAAVAAEAMPPAAVASPEFCRLAAAYNAANRGVSLVVMVDGKVVFQDYPNGGRADRTHELASGTKSFWGVAAAAAAHDGLLRLDEKVADTLPEWRDDPLKSQITIRQLLSLISGIATGGERGNVPRYAEAVAKPAVAAPGEAFRYGAVPFQVFGEVLKRKLAERGENPVDYLERRVLGPAGIEFGLWRRDASGDPHLPSGAHLTARNWAAFGELVRLGGTWQGNEIVRRDLLDQCFIGTEANPAYGLTWWLNAPTTPRQRLLVPQLTVASDLYRARDLPSDLVMAAGAGKQRLYVSRSLKLVVVRQANAVIDAIFRHRRDPFSDAEFLSRLLFGTDAGGQRLAAAEPAAPAPDDGDRAAAPGGSRQPSPPAQHPDARETP